MDLNANSSPNSSPARKVPRIVEDDKKELRMELKKKASTLQKCVHFEATIKPHIIKLTKDVDDLVLQLDEIDASVKSMKKNIEKEQQIKTNNANFSEENRNARESKIQEIVALEEEMQSLLREKQKYLSMANHESFENEI